MLTDRIKITLVAGHGGQGKVARFPGRKGRPSGGDGGDGGHVFVRVIDNLTALNRYAGIKQLNASNGQPGGPNRRSGKNGEDLEIVIPVGTTLTDLDTAESWEFDHVGERTLICQGGRGGRGNGELKGSSAEPGLPGQERNLECNLRLIADIGLIGLPNAGKTSLLNLITAAKAKTGSYEFTTLEPNLGALNGKIIADIPGLIEGASKGKGLGHKFLKHIEKVSLLVHCISSESKDLEHDYNVIRHELGNYNPALLDKPEIILLTKIDLLSDKELKVKVKKLQKLNPNVQTASIYASDIDIII